MTTDAPSKPALYSDREEWRDIKPLEQSDLENPLVPIFYPIEYKDAMDYFRGIVAVGEHSERVMKLTEHIIRMNPAHYSVWQYRYNTLLTLLSPELFREELNLMDELCVQQMKYYQIWTHRKLLLLLPTNLPVASSSVSNTFSTLLPTPVQELTYLSRILAVDSKNYHTWAYRQWLLTYYGDTHPDLWGHELLATDMLIRDDVRNNSAWHHRFFVCFASGAEPLSGEQGEQVVKREIAYVKTKIATTPNNLSAWNYLRGILDKKGVGYPSLKGFVQPFTVSHEAQDDTEIEFYDLDNPRPSSSAQLPCSLAIEFLADAFVQEGQRDAATELFTSLAEEHDQTRKRYWDYRIRELTEAKTSVS